MSPSDYMTSAVTIFVGLFVFAVYVLQKRDVKRNAAKILSAEITGAEDRVSDLRQKIAESDGKEIGETLILTSNSWNKYKHLFIRDLTEKQWRKVGEFFENCEVLNNAVRENGSFFGQNSQAIRDARYQAAASFVSKAVSEVESGKFNKTLTDGTQVISDDAATQVKNQVESELKAFNEILEESLNATNAHYNPMKPINDTSKVLKYMETNLSDGEIGIKLRKIGNRWF